MGGTSHPVLRRRLSDTVRGLVNPIFENSGSGCRVRDDSAWLDGVDFEDLPWDLEDLPIPNTPLVGKLRSIDGVITLRFLHESTGDVYQEGYDIAAIASLDRTFHDEQSFAEYLMESLKAVKEDTVPIATPGSLSCSVWLSDDRTQVYLKSMVQPDHSFMKPISVTLELPRVHVGTQAERHANQLRQQAEEFGQVNNETADAFQQALEDMGSRLEVELRAEVEEMVNEVRRELQAEISMLRLSLGPRVVFGDDNWVINDRQGVKLLYATKNKDGRWVSSGTDIYLPISSQEQANQIALFTSLTDLNLSGCSFLQSLDFLRPLTQITSLSLSGCSSVADISILASLPALRSLDLSNCVGLKDLRVLDTLPALERLTVTGCHANAFMIESPGVHITN